MRSRVSKPGRRMGTRQVPPGRRVLGIDLAGASSAKTGFALIAGEPGAARLEKAGLQPVAETPAEAERQLVELIDGLAPNAIAIDSPLTLPPCLTCPSYCRGPDPKLCELVAAQEMWAAGSNPVSRRLCELKAKEAIVGLDPKPTMGLGIITARAVALVKKLEVRGSPPASIARHEVLEVYPAASLLRLADQDKKLGPKQAGEGEGEFCARVATGLSHLGLEGIDNHRAEIEASRDVLDAVIAAYTGWLYPDGLEAPPDGFNVASGWIWFPKAA
jgi:predicted nuclease with RNAse H fold